MIYVVGAILYILTAHFVSDFVMQTDEMAQNKSKSNYWLTQHIIAYGKGFILFAMPICLFDLSIGFDIEYMAFRTLGFILINMALHWVTDYITSRQTSKLWAEKRVHDFFVMIGIDQLTHAYCLIITFYLLFLM